MVTISHTDWRSWFGQWLWRRDLGFTAQHMLPDHRFRFLTGALTVQPGREVAIGGGVGWRGVAWGGGSKQHILCVTQSDKRIPWHHFGHLETLVSLKPKYHTCFKTAVEQDAELYDWSTSIIRNLSHFEVRHRQHK